MSTDPRAHTARLVEVHSLPQNSQPGRAHPAAHPAAKPGTTSTRHRMLPQVLEGAVITLCGDFVATASHADLVALLEALGARVRADLSPETTHLVRGARAARLAALLGRSTLERQADELVAAGFPLDRLDEQDLEAWIAPAIGARTLREAIAWARLEEKTPGRNPAAPSLSPLTRVLASLREGPIRARVAAAEELGHRGDPAALAALAEVAVDAHYELLVAATRAALAIGGAEAFEFLAARMSDARLVDRALRERIARWFEDRAEGRSLDALAGALRTLRGACGVEEAAAFGRLAAKGVTRWGRRGPTLVLEFEAPHRGASATDVIALARHAGGHEILRDERGVPVHRVRIDPLPPLPAIPTGGPAAYELLALLGRRRNARAWVAGVPLPASLPWTIWLELLGPLAPRARQGAETLGSKR